MKPFFIFRRSARLIGHAIISMTKSTNGMATCTQNFSIGQV